MDFEHKRIMRMYVCHMCELYTVGWYTAVIVTRVWSIRLGWLCGD